MPAASRILQWGIGPAIGLASLGVDKMSTSLPLDWMLIAAGIGWFGSTLLSAVRRKWFEPQDENAPCATSATPVTVKPVKWEPSNTERGTIKWIDRQVLTFHGHSDEAGLYDDLRTGKPLNGPCWICGKPRVRREWREDGVS